MTSFLSNKYTNEIQNITNFNADSTPTKVIHWEFESILDYSLNNYKFFVPYIGEIYEKIDNKINSQNYINQQNKEFYSERVSVGTEILKNNSSSTQLILLSNNGQTDCRIPYNNFSLCNQSSFFLNKTIENNLENLGGIPPFLEGLAGFKRNPGHENKNTLNHLKNQISIKNINNDLSNNTGIKNRIVANFENINPNLINSKKIPSYKSKDQQALINSNSNQSRFKKLKIPNITYTSNNSLHEISFQKTDLIRLAISSLESSLTNKIEIIEMENNKLVSKCNEKLEAQISKLMWSPRVINRNTLACCTNMLNLFSYNSENHELDSIYELKNPFSKSPLNSFDWSNSNPAILGTSSKDKTCTIWDLMKFEIHTHLMELESEVLDIAFSLKNENFFISSDVNGQIHLYDMRNLKYPKKFFESNHPIDKIAFNNENSNLISIMLKGNKEVNIIDIRQSKESLVQLRHSSHVNDFSWASKKSGFICTVGEDKLVNIWNIDLQIVDSPQNPIKLYETSKEIFNVDWSFNNPEWIAISYGNKLQLLKV